jgi:hydroxyacylglutathione hydrolase
MLQVKVFTFSPFSENTYILYNEHKQAIIIDPGNYAPYEDVQLRTFIQEQQLQPQLIANTHCHLDHIFGVNYCINTFKIPFAYHTEEQQIADRLLQSAALFGVKAEPVAQASYYLEEGKELTLGTDVLKILYVPGHSPGHLCFYCEAQNFVIAGDTLFEGSVGRTDLYKGDQNLLIQSIHRELLTLPEVTKVYSGHGANTSIGIEKMNNPYL